jgi:hypothetical protein
MELHKYQEFDEILLSAEEFFIRTQNLNITKRFIEKDYYICRILFDLSKSEFNDKIFFKGGTSLSKTGITERFSEDLDLFVYTGNINSSKQAEKTLNQKISHFIQSKYPDFYDENESEIGGNFRKLFLNYSKGQSSLIKPLKRSLEVEIKCLVSDNKSEIFYYPADKKTVVSYLALFLKAIDRQDIVDENNLNFFEVNTISPKRTICDKISRLTRISTKEQYEWAFANHIRDFYDLYVLVNNTEYKDFIGSFEFMEGMKRVVMEDSLSVKFEQRNNLSQQVVFSNPDKILSLPSVKNAYLNELPALLFNPIKLPPMEDIAGCFKAIYGILQKFDNLQNP